MVDVVRILIGAALFIVVPALIISKGGSDLWGLFSSFQCSFYSSGGFDYVNPNESKVVVFSANMSEHRGQRVLFVNPLTQGLPFL